MSDEAALAAFSLVAVVAALLWAAKQRATAGAAGNDSFSTPSGGLNDGTQTQTDTAASQEWTLSEAQVMWKTPAKGLPFESVFVAATAAYALPHGLLSRIAYQESRYNPAAQSSKGAIGLMQFMPDTARDVGIDPADANQSIWGAAKYLRDLFNRFGNWTEAVASYNWGQGNVARQGLAAAPKETRDYLAAVLGDVGLLT